MKRGIAAIFFVIKFLTKFLDKKWKISEEYKNIRDYLEITERYYCATCVANLDHYVPVFSLTEEKCKKEDKKEGLLDSVIECPPVAGDIIGIIEYQAVFLMVIKKNKNFILKPKLMQLKRKRSCLIRTY